MYAKSDILALKVGNMKNVTIGVQDGFNYDDPDILIELDIEDIPSKAVEVCGYWYFTGPDGHMWQCASTDMFTDGTAQNVAIWTKWFVGDSTDEAAKLVHEANNVALAALQAKLAKS